MPAGSGAAPGSACLAPPRRNAAICPSHTRTVGPPRSGRGRYEQPSTSYNSRSSAVSLGWSATSRSNSAAVASNSACGWPPAKLRTRSGQSSPSVSQSWWKYAPNICPRRGYAACDILAPSSAERPRSPAGGAEGAVTLEKPICPAGQVQRLVRRLACALARDDRRTCGAPCTATATLAAMAARTIPTSTGSGMAAP
jgi:hypothetical protein